MGNKLKNIILITADQMRWDCIEALGKDEIKTPYLNSMIKNGVAFTKAYSATPTCIPARAALFTGLKQTSHKRVGYEDGIDWNYEVTIPGVFAENGYHTHCCGKMHVWPPRSLMGFHSVDLHDGFLHHRNVNTPAKNWWERVDDYIPYLQQHTGYDADINDLGIDCNSWVARTYPFPEHTHPTNWTVTKSIDFLRKRDSRKPFFLWTSFVAPHPPYVCPSYYFDMYNSAELDKPHIGEWSKELGEMYPEFNCFEGRLSENDLHRMKSAYYGLITHMDHQIGRLLRALKDEGVLAETIILFTSDHGEMLGDHNMFRKGYGYEGSCHVPMILYDPGNNTDIKSGTECDILAELRDVFPTLLEAAGVNIPDGVEGHSLLKMEHEDRCCGNYREYIHGEHSSQQGNYSIQFVVTEKLKYIWHSNTGKEFLFDLEKDPYESCDLSKDKNYKIRVENLRNILINELGGRQEGYVENGKLCIGKEAVTVLN